MSAAKRKNRRRRQRRAGAILFLLCAVAGIVLSMTVFFNVTDIVVSGKLTQYTKEQVIEASGIAAGANLFRTNLRQKEEAIWMTLPYIEEVKIHRKLPGTLVIEVSEIGGLLSIQCASGYAIVSPGLKILEVAAEPRPGSAVITGMESDKPAAGKLYESTSGERQEFLVALIASLQKRDMLQHVDSANLSDKLNYEMVYDGRFLIMIGTANEIDYKISLLFNTLNERLKPEDTGRIDLSTAGRATVKLGKFPPQEEETVPPEEDYGDPESEAGQAPSGDDDQNMREAPEDD